MDARSDEELEAILFAEPLAPTPEPAVVGS
jgi:hypothetical protein